MSWMTLCPRCGMILFDDSACGKCKWVLPPPARRNCASCGGEITGHGSRKYCSTACAEEARKRRDRESYRQGARRGNVAPCSGCEKPVGRRKGDKAEPMCHECRRKQPGYRPTPYAPQWKPQLVQCPTCGEMFEQYRWGQVYCRPEHRPEFPRVTPLANSNERGYGYDHQKARLVALDEFVPGTPCPRCNDPMWADQELHLDHTDDRSGYLGLSHASCNRLAAMDVRVARLNARRVRNSGG